MFVASLRCHQRSACSQITVHTYGSRTIPQDQKRVWNARYLFRSAQFRTWHPCQTAVIVIKLTVAQKTKTYLVPYTVREFIIISEKPEIGSYSKSKESNPRPHTPTFHYYSPSYVLVCQFFRSLQVYQLRLRVHLRNLSLVLN